MPEKDASVLRRCLPVHSAVPTTKAIAVVLRRRAIGYWRIAEERMPRCVGRQAMVQIVACRAHSILETLARNLRQLWRRWVVCGLGMRASGESNSQQWQGNQAGKQSSHGVGASFFVPIAAHRNANPPAWKKLLAVQQCVCSGLPCSNHGV